MVISKLPCSTILMKNNFLLKKKILVELTSMAVKQTVYTKIMQRFESTVIVKQVNTVKKGEMKTSQIWTFPIFKFCLHLFLPLYPVRIE